MSEALVTKEHLETLEAIIRDGLQGFMAVGLALIEIRECYGYRLRGFGSFEDYCQSTFGFTARHGRRMIQAAHTARDVVRVSGQRVKTEGAARALAPVAGNDKALRHVKARLEARGQSFGNAPASAISAIVDEVMERPAQQVRTRQIKPSGDCPECETTPRAYRLVDGIWQCGACGAEVRLTVRRVKAAA